MPRLKGIGMPSKRKRKTAKLQEVPEPDADELDQGSACGPASPTHSSPPTVDSDEDLMPLERELATAEHDLALARAALDGCEWPTPSSRSPRGSTRRK